MMSLVIALKCHSEIHYRNNNRAEPSTWLRLSPLLTTTHQLTKSQKVQSSEAIDIRGENILFSTQKGG